MTNFTFTDKLALEAAVRGARSEKAIEAALKKAGFDFENVSDEYGYPNFRMETADGYIRIYRNSRKETLIQEWKKDLGITVGLAPAEEVNWTRGEAMEFAKNFIKKHKKVPVFTELTDSERYLYVVFKTAKYFLDLGIYSREDCWARAISNAQTHRKKGFEKFLNKWDYLDTVESQANFIKQCCVVTGR